MIIMAVTISCIRKINIALKYSFGFNGDYDKNCLKKQLYSDAIIPCNNFIQTIFPQNQIANNEIIFLTPASLYSTS